VIRFLSCKVLIEFIKKVSAALVEVMSDMEEVDFLRLAVEKIPVMVVEAHFAYAARFGFGGGGYHARVRLALHLVWGAGGVSGGTCSFLITSGLVTGWSVDD